MCLLVALPTTPLLVLLALIVASFFFALAESALFSLGTWRARRLVESGRRGSERVGALLAQPSDVLAAIALGNTLSNSLLVALTIGGGLALDPGIPGIWWAALGLLLLLLTCEVTPKALGVRSPETWALRVAEPLWFFVSLTRPVRKIAQKWVDGAVERLVPKSAKVQAGVSDDEYADLIELAHQQGTLGAGEKEILLQVLSLDERTARDVMQPRARMVLLPDDLPMDQMVEEARKSGHHWIPLYDESPDNVVGVLNTRTLLLDADADLFMAMEFLEEQCQADLAGELEDHSQQIRARLVEVVVDAEQADSADDEGHEWVMSLTREDGEAFLQALNELRLRAWEQLGKPNPPEVPEDLSEDSPDVLHWWTLGIASRFQSKILSAIDPE